MAVYTLKLTTLTPVHIGEGRELRRDFDFVIHQKHFYRLDEDAVLQARADRLVPDRRGMYPYPGTLLTEADFENGAFFRYVLPGEVRSQKTDARVQSCIKDVFDRPYIPGSSLKGALRTALAWAGFAEMRLRVERNKLGRSAKYAGLPLEKEIFGPNPNEDLLRVLQVSDLHGPQEAGQRLILINAQVLTGKGPGSPVELEAVRPETVFMGELHVDETLFSRQAEERLHFANRRRWLDELLPRTQRRSLLRAEKLAAWFDALPENRGHKVAAFYHQLAGLQLPANQAVLQLGWGTGWDGMTLGTHLQTDENLFEWIVSNYRLNKAGSRQRTPGDSFPNSRRVMMSKENADLALRPLGWVLLELQPKDRN